MKLFLPLTFLFSILALATAQINTNEVEECKIINSIVGDDNNSNCCEYNSNQTLEVSCENGHITTFTLDLEILKNKTTEFPTEIFKLKNLEQLKIYSGEFISIPPAIGELSELEFLAITRGKLKEIPNEISQLKKLFYLSLKFNEIEKIPPTIGELEELEELVLKDNKIRELPEELFKLKKLINLDLEHNQIEKIPESIGELTELEELNIRRNNIKEMPQSLSKLKKLQINGQENLRFNKLIISIILIGIALLM